MTIKQVEVTTIEEAFDAGYVTPQPPERLSGKTVAVVGSGPAGLAAAQQLTRAGHTVAVYERADRPGGLLRYGIPEFKMEKSVLDRRLAQMEAEGTRFRNGVAVGTDVTGKQLRDRYDAVVLAVGATVPRDLPVPGRELDGVMQAMEFLPPANRVALGESVEGQVTAEGKDVIIIGGGDTGADCLGTSIRQGAKSVTSLEIMPRPGEERAAGQPWPTYPMTFRVASAHEEGGERVYAVSTQEIVGEDGRVSGIRLVDVEMGERGFAQVEGTERVLPAQLILLAMGFLGPEGPGWSSSSASSSTNAPTSSGTATTCPPSRVSSSPVTPGVASRSSCGRSPRAAPRPPASTSTSPARARCRARSTRPTAPWSSEQV